MSYRATSADFFVRTPANCLTVRYRFKAITSNSELDGAIDVRLNRQNYTRSIAIHAPSDDPEIVANVVGIVFRDLRHLIDLRAPGGEITIGKSPDVACGAGVSLFNGDELQIAEEAPWIDQKIGALDFVLTPFVWIYCDCDERAEPLNKARQFAGSHGFRLIFFGTQFIKEMVRGERPNFFISHDARNKDQIARPIAAKLSAKGEVVWFDEFSLRPGDNLREAIETGLRSCEQCVLLITKEFLSNNTWAKEEFDGVFSRQISENRKIIIPVWIDVTRAEVSAFSLSLANRFAVVTTLNELASPGGVEKVAHAITTGKPAE